jgi:hypothetical protein
VIIRRLAPQDRSTLEALARAHPFKPYRNYRILSRAAQQEVLRAEIESALTHPRATGLLVEEREDARAAIIVRPLDWETSFFGIPMGRVEHLFSSTPALTAPALKAGLEALCASGIRHVTLRLDVADVETIVAAEAAGFRLMDSLVTYTARPQKEPPRAIREVGRVRELRDEDAPVLVEIAADAFAGFRGRFHLDPHIPRDRCDAFYVEWARQTAARAMADTVLVAEGVGGHILGFLGFRRREPVSSAGGVPVFGGGLGACRRHAPGAYAALSRAGTLWAHARGGLAECQTQIYNFSTVRIYEAVGLHYVRAEYTLHAWLGD